MTQNYYPLIDGSGEELREGLYSLNGGPVLVFRNGESFSLITPSMELSLTETVVRRLTHPTHTETRAITNDRDLSGWLHMQTKERPELGIAVERDLT